jgi:hypothetical protein
MNTLLINRWTKFLLVRLVMRVMPKRFMATLILSHKPTLYLRPGGWTLLLKNVSSSLDPLQ